MVCIHTKFHMPSRNGSLVIVIKPIAKCGFHADATFIFYFLKKIQQMLHIFQRIIINHHFRTLGLLETVLLSQHNPNFPYFMTIYISIYGSTVLLLDLDHLFSFLILYAVSRTPWTGISPSQGRYLHTEQRKHKINAHRHPCLEWDSNPQSQRSSERRQFMPQTARPL
jgi:hypothetical protein